VDASSTEGGEVLPAGSWVRAKILTGAEANNRYPYNMTLQLDYAFTGPNGTKIPLQGCITIAEAKADLSIERVIILPTKLSCVRDDGEYVERQLTGFVAGRDSSNGVQGVYSSKQGKVFLQALLASIAKGAGAAVQMTQFSETIGGSENATVAKNFTGNVGQFALAKGVTDAATLVTDWYLNQAKALLPTIMVGSGEDVWIIVTESVEVPPLAEAMF
jgi:conjugal transfer pilus assembly protein TraB